VTEEERIARDHVLFRELDQRISAHESPGLDHVVERNGRYAVVERAETSSR
jgi:hypothetical protein